MTRDRDIGDIVLPKQAILNTAVTAGGAGDGTEIDGASIDRLGLGSRYASAELFIHGNATLASGLTLTIAANLQHSDDDSTFTDFGTALTAAVVATGASGGSAALLFETSLEDLDISKAKRYIRAQVTPTLSATQTDTMLVGAALVLGGAESLPAA